jgi:hypothetical protein
MSKVMLFLAALTALSTAALADSADAWHIGQPAMIMADAIGCQKDETIERALKMMRDHDKEALSRLILPALVTGECVTYPAGTAGILTEQSAWHGIAKVRPRGDPNEYWFPSYAVTQ